MFCSIHDFTFLGDTKNFKDKSLLSLQKTFACAIFGKICYVAYSINCNDKLICLHASLQECDCADLIDKPGECGYYLETD